MRSARRLVVGLAFLLVASTARGDAEDGGRTVRFDFKEERWDKVLEWIAKANDLNVQSSDPIPGRFTYSDPLAYTPAEALDLVHAVLLDRGVTLIPKGGALTVARLGDDMPWELVPFVPADKLHRVSRHEMVTTTFPLYSVSGAQLAPELQKALSPRGRIHGNKVVSRIVVSDRAGVCVQLLELLRLIDPPIDPSAVRLRVYRLRHAAAREVEPVVREILGPSVQPKPGGGGASAGGAPFDPEAIQNVIFSRRFLESFTPGLSMEGIGREKPKEKTPTRLSADPIGNALLVVAEPDVLGKVDRLVDAMERPASLDSAAPIHIRAYEVKTGQADAFAQRLRAMLAQTGECMITGVDRWIVVRGTQRSHDDVKRLLASMSASDETLAAFPLSRRQAEFLVLQIERLFEIDGDRAPRVVADVDANAILVRGSPDQIEQVRRILADLGELPPESPAAPGFRSPPAGRTRRGD